MNSTSLDPNLLRILVCPMTKEPLRYDAEKQELISDAAQLAFPSATMCLFCFWMKRANYNFAITSGNVSMEDRTLNTFPSIFDVSGTSCSQSVW